MMAVSYRYSEEKHRGIIDGYQARLKPLLKGATRDLANMFRLRHMETHLGNFTQDNAKRELVRKDRGTSFLRRNYIPCSA